MCLFTQSPVCPVSCLHTLFPASPRVQALWGARLSLPVMEGVHTLEFALLPGSLMV